MEKILVEIIIVGIHIAAFGMIVWHIFDLYKEKKILDKFKQEDDGE